MKRYTFLAICVLMFPPSATAANTRLPALEAKLPTPVTVYRTDNVGAGFADIQNGVIYLDKPAADALMRGAPRGWTARTPAFIRGVEMLYHEWWHVAFRETDEKFTEAGMWTVLRYMLRTYWGMSAKQAQSFYDAGFTAGPCYAPIPYHRTRVDPLLTAGPLASAFDAELVAARNDARGVGD